MTLPLQPPRIVHHSAAMDGHPAPPNSLELVRASLEHGAEFIELDITALADDDYLLVHDSALDSETTGSGPVAECAAKDVRELRYKVDGAPTTVHVPVLREVVALFAEYPTDTRLQLDFKNVVPFTDDEPLHRLIDIVEPLGERVIVSSPADWQLRRLRKLASWLDVGFDILAYFDWHNPKREASERYPRNLGAYGYLDDHPLASRKIWSTAEYLADRCASFIGLVPDANTFYINHRVLSQSLDEGFNWADALHDAGIICDAWTLDVGDPDAEATAKRLLAAGVDQFTSNTPVALRALVDETI